MRTQQKLYQILEKAQIDTKIAVEIQDWIVDTIEEKRDQGITNMQDTKILPMHQEVRTGFDSIRYEMNQRSEFLRNEMNQRFESFQSNMDARFESMQSTMDARFESMQSTMDARFESMQLTMDARFESMQSTMDARFESMQSTMDARFESIEKRLDAINFTIRILGIPIVGATIGGLGVVFLQIYERLIR
ncbi:hypothetical protein [Leptospira jelokensis]|uniref:DUF1640 domain-containing protein n=1 Tax=Leptospira jelokensis TaxID=2484931 RepID=A0A4Z1A0I6_9LEPT|nr:hypothetical protein [Leptospira jelokensis]TGL67485.1 hypothetical protein EHQ62_08780 [Leptospira jelokensis]